MILRKAKERKENQVKCGTKVLKRKCDQFQNIYEENIVIKKRIFIIWIYNFDVGLLIESNYNEERIRLECKKVEKENNCTLRAHDIYDLKIDFVKCECCYRWWSKWYRVVKLIQKTVGYNNGEIAGKLVWF